MRLCSLIYKNENQNIIEYLRNIQTYFQEKNCAIGISESVEDETHFIKLYSKNDYFNEKMKIKLYYFLSELIYIISIENYYKNELQNYLCNSYFFLKYEELKKVKDKVIIALQSNGGIEDENNIYYINRKNNAIEKIKKCVVENEEINIDGYIMFRMKELRHDIESIVDKVIEKYMVEKEYDEFIKLLKYFVEIQDSKIEYVKIIIDRDENFEIRDREGKNIMMDFIGDIVDSKLTNSVNIEDIIISGLITNSPEIIAIYGEENCKNKEFINTIKNVFLSRVEFYEYSDSSIKEKNY